MVKILEFARQHVPVTRHEMSIYSDTYVTNMNIH